MFTVRRQQYLANIYDQYSDSIYRFLLLKTSSVEIAQDLTSEVFLRFVNKVMLKSGLNITIEVKLQQKIQNPRAFLYKTARNLTIDYYRTKGRVVTLDDSSIIKIDADKPRSAKEGDIQKVAEKFDLEKDMASIAKYLTKIPDESAEVIILRYIEEMPFSEISEIVAKPEGTIRVMLHRGMKELRELASAD